MAESETQTSKISDGLGDIFSFIESLRASWHWLASGCAIGLLGAIGFLILAPAKYEAEAMIQPATVGSPSTPVEPISQTLERLKLVSFYGDEIVKECHATSAKNLVEERLKIRIVRGSNLLHVEYAAGSSAVAEACVARVVELLKQSQAAVAAPLIKALEDQLALTKKQILSRERHLAQFEVRGGRSMAPTSTEAMFVMLKSEELIKLYERYQDQSRGLTEPSTQPAKLLGPIYASDEAVSPKKLPATIIGLVGGLCCGFLAVFLTRGWSRFKSDLRPLDRQDAQ